MRSRREVNDAFERGLAELDRLVSLEFEALTRRQDRTSMREALGTASGQEPPIPARANELRAHERRSRIPRELIWEDAESCYSDADRAEPYERSIQPEPMEDEAAQPYSQEEQAFIDGCVEWLVGRDNRDMIVGSIWDRLTEAEPGSFYTPPQPGAATVTAGGGDSKVKETSP